MNSIISNLNFIFIGLLLASSFSQINIYLFSRKVTVQLLLALLGFSTALFLYNSSLNHGYLELIEATEIFKNNVSLYLITMGFVVLILYQFNGKRHKGLVGFSLMLVATMFALNIFLSNGIIYSSISGYKEIVLPWNESYFMLQGEVNFFYEALATLFFATISLLLVLSFHSLKKEKYKTKAILFMALAIVYILVNIYDVLIDIGIVEGIYFSEYAMILIVILLNHELVVELANKLRIERKLVESNTNFNDLIEKVDLLVVGLDINGKIEFINPYMKKLLGYAELDLIGSDYSSIFIPSENQKDFISVFNSFIKGGDYSKNTNKILKKDKSPLVISWSNVIIKNEEGSTNKILCIGSDITEKMKSRDELKKAYLKIESIKSKIEEENSFLREHYLNGEFNNSLIKGRSNSMKYVLANVNEVAKTDSTVLIEGETGVGKSLIGQAIFEASNRKNERFIKVNCGALSPSLIESELFGHEKGAFTGASSKRVGRFELADKGTLFLDEIGELPLELQSKLLRVLQTGEFERLGGEKTIKVDIRFIAATNKILSESVESGSFRGDLYYRLSVFPITVPPLRKRKDDIEILTDSFIEELCLKSGKEKLKISISTIKQLKEYSWPGNIRELRNVLERAVIISKGKTLVLRDKLIEKATKSDHFDSLEEMERNFIHKVLEECNWKVSGKNGASQILKINEATLRSKMKKLGISKPMSKAFLN